MEIKCSSWSRLHIDVAGPFIGKNVLIVVDSFSLWLECEAYVVNNSNRYHRCIARNVQYTLIPNVVVSENVAQFTTIEFSDFLKNNAVRKV